MFSLKEYLHKDPVDFQSNPARIAWVNSQVCCQRENWRQAEN